MPQDEMEMTLHAPSPGITGAPAQTPGAPHLLPRQPGQMPPLLHPGLLLALGLHLALLAWWALGTAEPAAAPRPRPLPVSVSLIPPAPAAAPRQLQAPPPAPPAPLTPPRPVPTPAPKPAAARPAARQPAPAQVQAPALPSPAAPREAEAAPGPLSSTPPAPAAASSSATAGSSQEAAVSAPRFDVAYLHNPKPPYPLLARRRGDEGRVVLRVQVSAAGLAEQVQLHRSSGNDSLDEAALNTVRNWRFVPAQRGDTPVAASVLVPITFKLEN